MCICPGVLEWYTPNIERYQHSSVSEKRGTISALLFSMIPCINAHKCCFLSVFLFRFTSKDLALFIACFLLLGNDCISLRNVHANVKPHSDSSVVLLRHWISSTESPCLSLSFDLLNNDSHCSERFFTYNVFGHGSKIDIRPFPNTCVLL